MLSRRPAPHLSEICGKSSWARVSCNLIGLKAILTRSSSPKLLPLCGALIHRDLFRTKEGYGRAFEAAVGACLINHGFEVLYWRDGNAEVDFVTRYDGDLFAIEVKSGRPRSSKGMAEFAKLHKTAKPLYVTDATIEAFLADPARVLGALK